MASSDINLSFDTSSAGASDVGSDSPLQNHDPSTVYDRLSVVLRRLRTLIRVTERGQGILDDKEVLEALKVRHRTLSVLDLIKDRYLIAVAGPQGSGKTTAMSWLYDLPDGYLPINAITGERLPVMLVEHEKESFNPFVYRLNSKEGSLERQSITKAECEETARSPGRDDVVIELRVPARFFGRENRGFLLLPGEDRRQDAHVTLAQQVIPSVETALVCVDDGLLARGSVDQAMRRMQNEIEEEAGARILYGITKPRDPETTEEVAETIQDRFDVEDDRRIVVVRSPENVSAEIPEWGEDLRVAVQNYTVPRSGHRQAQIDTLRTSVEELERNLDDLENELAVFQAGKTVDQYDKVKPVLEQFDQQVKKQREQLEKSLQDELSKHARRAQEKGDWKIVDKSLGRKLKEIFVTNPVQKKRDVQKMVRNVWEEADPAGAGGPVLDCLTTVVERNVANHIEHTDASSRALPGGAETADESTQDARSTSMMQRFRPVQLASEPRARGDGVTIKPEVIRSVQALMPTREGADHNPEELSDQFQRHVRALPVLALETVRFLFAARMDQDIDMQAVEKKEHDETEAFSDLLSKTAQVRSQGKGVLKGMLVMLGADAVPDAELDILQELFGLAGVSVGTTPLAIAVGVLAAGYGTVSIIKSVRRRDLEQSEMLETVFDRLSSRTKTQTLQAYDDFMAYVREQLEQGLRRRYNLETGLGDYHRILWAQGEVDKSIRNLRGELPVRL
jgi:exonuclease VII small subunit